MVVKRPYKDTGKEISLLGLGCMRLPKVSPDKDDIDYEKAQEIVDYAYAHGVNYFDTAHMYHGGKSEEFVGHALKKYDRSSFYLATKMPIWMADTPEDVDRIFNLQLQRLQTDYVDFYLCHSLGEGNFKKLRDFKAYEYLAKKKEEGFIRHLGFSFHDTPDVLEKIADAYPWDFGQIQFNYLDWEFLDSRRMYKILEERGIPSIIMEPVRGGTLADLCESSNALFKAARPDDSVASWAIRYAATPPNILTVLSGMSNMEQIMDNVKTLSDFQPVTPEDRQIIDQALTIYKQQETVPCTGCRYCVEYCPVGVNIPKMFDLYNHFAIGKNKWDYREDYQAVPDSERMTNCISCGNCVEYCPQSIEIPERLSFIREKTAAILK